MSRLDFEAATDEVRSLTPAVHSQDALPLAAYEALLELVSRINRSVRRRLLPPITADEANTLLGYIDALLTFLDQELPYLVTLAKAEASPDESLIVAGERLLGELSAHGDFADHYFDETVGEKRKERRSDEVREEVAAMKLQSNSLRDSATKYLGRLEKLLQTAAPPAGSASCEKV